MAIPMRVIILIIITCTAAVEYIARLNINVAMVKMVLPTDENKTVHDICQVQAQDSATNASLSDEERSKRFHWSPKTQGMILGAYFYAYVVVTLPGGRTAEVVGAKWVITIGLVGAAVINFVTPLIASNGG